MGVRLISSGVGSAIALTILFLHNTPVFPVAIAAVCIILLFEILRATDALSCKPAAGIVFLYAAAAPFLIVGKAAQYHSLVTIVAVLAVFGCFILYHEKLKFEQVFTLVLAMLLIPASMGGCVALNAISKTYGIMYVVLALCGAWLADSGAYFVGTFLGKHKLCPSISPKKTVEGFVGGIVTNGLLFLAIVFVYAKIMHSRGTSLDVNYLATFFLGNLCALVGTMGDLTASLIKRQKKIKDYGNIMPGHGGLYDRFDSVVFVVPFFCAFVSRFAVFS